MIIKYIGRFKVTGIRQQQQQKCEVVAGGGVWGDKIRRLTLPGHTDCKAT